MGVKVRVTGSQFALGSLLVSWTFFSRIDSLALSSLDGLRLEFASCLGYASEYVPVSLLIGLETCCYRLSCRISLDTETGRTFLYQLFNGTIYPLTRIRNKPSDASQASLYLL